MATVLSGGRLSGSYRPSSGIRTPSSYWGERMRPRAGGVTLPLFSLVFVALVLGEASADVPVDPVAEGTLSPEAAAPDTVRAQAFADGDVRALWGRARDAREDQAADLDSYEARVHQRERVELMGPRDREGRALEMYESVHRVHWERDQGRTVSWEGAYSADGIRGTRTDRDSEAAASLTDRLSRGYAGDHLHFWIPGQDQLRAPGVAQFAPVTDLRHPLADDATEHYRFHPGDTIRLDLGPTEEPVTVAEMRVEPRRSDPGLMEGSLWLDTASGAVVRAIYRQAATEDLLASDMESGAARFLPAVHGRVEQVTLDYARFDGRWWIPRSYSLRAVLHSRELGRILIRAETRMDLVSVNEPASAELDPEDVPAGWQRIEGGTGADTLRQVNILPPADSLHLAADLTLPGRRHRPAEDVGLLAPGELDELDASLQAIPRSVPSFRPNLRWGLDDGLLRYNRVEGLSAGVGGALPLGIR